RYHFGMLLGVADFETEYAYHRGKMRLHNGWLHGSGIVWGLDVELVDDKREIAVDPGLALDPAGRELHLDVRCCMDIAAWFDDRADVLAARAEVLALAPEDQPGKLLEHFRRFADLDTAAMGPAVEPDSEARLNYPGTDDAGVVLANVTGIRLEGSTGNWTLA